MSSREYKEYVVAALLHDVGKLVQRARAARGEHYRGHTAHSIEVAQMLKPAIEAAGLDYRRVEELIRDHHSTGGIGLYDKAAAAERAQGDDESGAGLVPGYDKFYEVPFMWYKGDELKGCVPPFPVARGTLRDLAPRPCEEARRLTPGAYTAAEHLLWRLLRALAARRMDYRQLVETLLHVLKAVAAFVPAAVYGTSRADTSLYAHLLVTAALASTGGRARLVGVNVGGIQNYIARVQRTKGAMAVLRGRSLYITLLQRAVVKRLIDELNRRMEKRLGEGVLTAANVLIDTGGENVLLIPSYQGVEEDLREAAAAVAKAVVEETRGKLKVYIAWTEELDTEAFARGKFREALTKLEEAMAEARAKTYVPLRVEKAQGKCEICGTPKERLETIKLPDVEISACPACALQHEIGRVARRLSAVIELKRPVKLDPMRIGACHFASVQVAGIPFVLVGETCADVPEDGSSKTTEKQCNLETLVKAISSLSGDIEAVYFVNETEKFILDIDGVAYGYLFTNAHLPLDEKCNFATLDLVGIGATLRLDGNDMGTWKYMAEETPSKFVTFSTALSVVFDFYGAHLANERKYREDVYLIYSGGDDAALVGTYKAFEYAAELVEYAEKWGFTVSAGAVIHDPEVPILYIWEEAGRREGGAKKDRKISAIQFARLRDVDFAAPISAVKPAFSLAYSLLRALEEELLARGALHKIAAHTAALYYHMKKKDARGAARTLINYTYYYNRNLAEKQEYPQELLPDKMANAVANFLKTREPSQEELNYVAQLHLALTLAHLIRKAQEKQERVQ